MTTTLSLVSHLTLWIGAAAAVAGLAGCDSEAEGTVSALNSGVEVAHPAHPCRSPDAMSTQKGCRPSTLTVGTK